MRTIPVVLNEELIEAADVAAKRRKLNRSALIREALDHPGNSITWESMALRAATVRERAWLGLMTCKPAPLRSRL